MTGINAFFRNLKVRLYKPHVDWGHGTDASLFIAGQRVATVLAYLTDIPKGCVGGCTHFPHLTREQPQGLRIVPVRGAACAWPNVSMHGMPLVETEHAAEPLIVSRLHLKFGSLKKHFFEHFEHIIRFQTRRVEVGKPL